MDDIPMWLIILSSIALTTVLLIFIFIWLYNRVAFIGDDDG